MIDLIDKQVAFIMSLIVGLILVWMGSIVEGIAIITIIVTWAFGKEGKAEPVANGMLGYESRSKNRRKKPDTE